MKILVRLPNWLGDMVMAVGFMNSLTDTYPGAEISVIAKKGLETLLPYFPRLKYRFIFSKAEFKGVSGAWRFGRSIRATERFDLYFSLPDSFSAGLIGFATGARQRVGFKAQGRGFLFSKTYTKPAQLHRVEEYMVLLERYSGKKTGNTSVELKNPFPKDEYVIININSEASSRRLTVAKAVELITALHSEVNRTILLIGAPKEVPFVSAVYELLPKDRIENRAGTTGMTDLIRLIGSARYVLTTDSGPAHLANALGTPTLVLFGAGNEANTAPYNKAIIQAVRLGKLSCEPCRKNVCVRYDVPQCLEQLNSYAIVATIKKELDRYG
jgi:ADP-heptose:LPS heptosyltransferase